MFSSKKRLYSTVTTIAAVLLLVAFLALFFHGGYHTKILVKLGLQEQNAVPDYALLGWEDCLKKMNYDADAVFLGNSITRGSDFAASFEGLKIVNLGYSGDSLKGMTSRVGMVQAVSPEKVFVMGGINGLRDGACEQSLDEYQKLIDALKSALPDAEIYVQSVLPISDYKEKSVCTNKTISIFNSGLQKIATEQGLVYVDLYSLYEKGGQLNPALTKDGIHLKSEAYSLWEEAVEPLLFSED